MLEPRIGYDATRRATDDCDDTHTLELTTMIAQQVSAKASYAAVSGLNKSRGVRTVRKRKDFPIGGYAGDTTTPTPPPHHPRGWMSDE